MIAGETVIISLWEFTISHLEIFCIFGHKYRPIRKGAKFSICPTHENCFIAGNRSSDGRSFRQCAEDVDRNM